MKSIFPLLMREKPALMILVLLESEKAVYASVLAKQVNYTYSHVIKVLQEFEKAGIVEFEKHGRMKVISLTEKGMEIAVHVQGLKALL